MNFIRKHTPGPWAFNRQTNIMNRNIFMDSLQAPPEDLKLITKSPEILDCIVETAKYLNKRIGYMESYNAGRKFSDWSHEDRVAYETDLELFRKILVTIKKAGVEIVHVENKTQIPPELPLKKNQGAAVKLTP